MMMPLHFSFALFALAATAVPQRAAPAIAGRYLTEDGAGIVQVAPCGSAMCGRLVHILKAKAGAPTVDVNNRNPALRNRPIQGITILENLTDQGADWRGTIYDPRNGKSYKSVVSRNTDGSLKVQGCIAFFCKTQRWGVAR
jgi:uncharacterized protein (DUF2147 family)